MEEPSREWDQALAGIEPVRFEFPYANPKLLRQAVVWGSAVYAVLCGALAVWGAFEKAGFAVVFGVVLFIYGEVVLVIWQRRWMDRLPEEVILRGMQMSIARHGFFGSSEEQYNILEIHDLRDALTDGGRYVMVLPLPGQRRYRPAVYEVSEPIRFSCRHGAYSFGGAPMDRAVASDVIERISAYDAAVRERLGMPSEPNITTYDRERVAEAMKRSWDVDVPHAALW